MGERIVWSHLAGREIAYVSAVPINKISKSGTGFDNLLDADQV